jgi:hypothetical protein
MNRAFLATLLGGLLLAAGGCKPEMDNKEAIRDGVIKHLSGMSGLNVSNMTITVTKATVNGDHAQADVEVRAKNGEPGAPAMELTYQLQKQGEGWVVLKGQATGGMQHPAPGEMPPQEAMPAGHPPSGGANGQLPASHPDFNSILNSAAPPAQTQGQPQPLKGQQPAPQPPASDAKP